MTVTSVPFLLLGNVLTLCQMIGPRDLDTPDNPFKANTKALQYGEISTPRDERLSRQYYKLPKCLFCFEVPIKIKLSLKVPCFASLFLIWKIVATSFVILQTYRAFGAEKSGGKKIRFYQWNYSFAVICSNRAWVWVGPFFGIYYSLIFIRTIHALRSFLRAASSATECVNRKWFRSIHNNWTGCLSLGYGNS